MLWDELTAKDFVLAREKAKGTCIVPMGVIEKHGTHLPLGTDVMIARRVAIDVAKIEPVVIFPYYFVGQISEAKHVPGTIAISPRLMYEMLEEVCSEIARNGFKKIILLNSHGGSPHLINFFIQSTLYSKKDYVVFNIPMAPPEDRRKEIAEVLGTDDFGSHAGNKETAMIMAERPDLVKMDQIEQEGLKNYGRLQHLKDAISAVSWYGDHPTHFAGDPSHASKEAGEKFYEVIAQNVARIVKAIKEDDEALKLQEEFFSKWDSI